MANHDLADHDLTGIWQGLYSYEGIGPHVGFTATLLETGGALYGMTHEREPWAGSSDLEASLSGLRSGQAVVFTKAYSVQDEAHPPIAYDGTVSADGTEIEGTWMLSTLHRETMSGRFLMSRPERRAVERERALAERR
ncbi:hypothetical protein [Enterovirga rhinocerotis]|uniref:Lipocalin-like protein n=1 Tax=Enterovirga rhinocerotis TaxID=1339210 RepID=A0A4R7CAG2_9HYPH|nr:hypothetical protein [Enterovirga rhinocerotis]TDR93787.1 hypothetical protein EV668_1054 [Enterovirga rhinocerotis]